MSVLILLFVCILLICVAYLDKRILKIIKNSVQLPNNYIVLFIILTTGFLFGWEYREDWGCFGPRSPLFGIKYLLLSFTSLGLLLISYLIKQRSFKLGLVLIEFVFWIVKLFYFKNHLIDILIYDSIAVVFRLFIISSLLKYPLKLRSVILMTLAVISIKAFVFRESLESKLEYEHSLKRSKLTQKALIGDWEGVCSYDTIFVEEIIHTPDTGLQNLDWIVESDTEYIEKRIPVIDSVKLHIDSNQMILYDFRNYDRLKLTYSFNYEFGGYAKEIDDTVQYEHYYSFWVDHSIEDSLKLSFSKMNSYYEFSMTKKTE